MGRRSTRTTKSGKYMNPTDQARKESRRRELKKNKKQRNLVRTAVLKAKDAQEIIVELEEIDKMEYNPLAPPKFNETVLTEKRGKLIATFGRIQKLYDQEDPSRGMELRRLMKEYENKQQAIITYYHQVKNAERVDVNQIPLPAVALPTARPAPLVVAMPPPSAQEPLRSILKQKEIIGKTRKPPGPPPGSPPPIGSSSSEETSSETGSESGRENKETDSKSRKRQSRKERREAERRRTIRFEDDESYDPSAPEKDTRLRFRPGVPVTELQSKLLDIAGQQPEPEKEKSSSESESTDERSSSPTTTSSSGESDDDEDDDEPMTSAISSTDAAQIPIPAGAEPQSATSGGDGLPPGPPPGLPQSLPPGPPPGLPQGFNPVPPRLGAVPPPPHTIVRPPFPLNLAPRHGPSVITAQPNIRARGAQQPSVAMVPTTIEKKAQLKYTQADLTKFIPTAVKVRREFRDTKGRVRRRQRMDQSLVPRPTMSSAETKDDAYAQFMKELEGMV